MNIVRMERDITDDKKYRASSIIWFYHIRAESIYHILIFNVSLDLVIIATLVTRRYKQILFVKTVEGGVTSCESCLPYKCYFYGICFNQSIDILDKLFRLCTTAVICDGIIVHRPWHRQKCPSAICSSIDIQVGTGCFAAEDWSA